LRPAALAFDSVHNYVYCLNPDGDSVTVIDAASNTVACRVPVGDNPIAFAWAPAADRMFVANRDGSSVSVINTTPTWVAEPLQVQVRRNPPLIVRGNLLLQRHCDHTTLRDAGGRAIQELRAGPNDVSRLPAGVYFLCESRAAARKLLLLR